ncbi:hypothetical protein [Glutamicibacter arilaitensis]|uniref:hypothetical protein n=1 Tax=Glutamicibacter arilaitensis TaxID=256701 RepID=UPI003FD3159E
MSRRPYIGKIWEHAWTDDRTGEQTPGIKLGGASGIAAHLTKDEAYSLANDIVDAADKLPEATTSPYKRQETPCGQSPLHTSQTLTNASGEPEQTLPASIAD